MTRVLLDEGVPKPLARMLREQGVDATAFPNDWKQLSNGHLLDHIESQGFDVLITSDKKMAYQQNMAHRKISVLVLPTNRRDEVYALLPNIVDGLSRVVPGQFSQLSSRD